MVNEVAGADICDVVDQVDAGGGFADRCDGPDFAGVVVLHRYLGLAVTGINVNIRPATARVGETEGVE